MVPGVGPAQHGGWLCHCAHVCQHEPCIQQDAEKYVHILWHERAYGAMRLRVMQRTIRLSLRSAARAARLIFGAGRPSCTA